MSADLSSLCARLAVSLQDAVGRVYPPDALSEGLRQALGEISRAMAGTHGGATLLTIAGLDGALETTLPPALEGLLLQGAAALVVGGRALRHAEQPALAAEGLPSSALAWAGSAWQQFLSACERLRMVALHGAVPPWPLDAGACWLLDDQDGERF